MSLLVCSLRALLILQDQCEAVTENVRMLLEDYNKMVSFAPGPSGQPQAACGGLVTCCAIVNLKIARPSGRISAHQLIILVHWLLERESLLQYPAVLCGASLSSVCYKLLCSITCQRTQTLALL